MLSLSKGLTFWGLSVAGSAPQPRHLGPLLFSTLWNNLTLLTTSVQSGTHIIQEEDQFLKVFLSKTKKGQTLSHRVPVFILGLAFSSLLR